jgi:hypothetical protein
MQTALQVCNRRWNGGIIIIQKILTQDNFETYSDDDSDSLDLATRSVS